LMHELYFTELAWVVAGPIIAIALIQTLRMFRAQVGANKLRVVYCALPLMLLAFLWGGVGVASYLVMSESWHQARPIIRETDQAIGMVAASQVGGQPRRITAEELAKSAPLSEGTKRWLRNATITIAAAPEVATVGPGEYFPGLLKMIVSNSELKGRVPYSAVLRRANGKNCSLIFRIQHSPGEKHNVGFVDVICDQ
jgi:hypothetical protein